MDGLRPEFSALLQLIVSRPAPSAKPGLLTNIEQRAWRGLIGMVGMLSFIGKSAFFLLRLLAQPRRIRWRPILHNLQTVGFGALPIVGLLFFPMGFVVAYQGANQLQRFGANIVDVARAFAAAGPSLRLEEFRASEHSTECCKLDIHPVSGVFWISVDTPFKITVLRQTSCQPQGNIKQNQKLEYFSRLSSVA